jgi:hypothetical protein
VIPETERRGQRTDRLAAILPPLFPSNGTRVRRRVSFVLFPFVTVALQQRTG